MLSRHNKPFTFNQVYWLHLKINVPWTNQVSETSPNQRNFPCLQFSSKAARQFFSYCSYRAVYKSKLQSKKEVQKKTTHTHTKKRCSGFNSLNSDERKSFYFRNYPLLYSVQFEKKLPAKKMTRTCRLYVVERFLQSIFFSSQTKTRKDLWRILRHKPNKL